MFNNASAEMDFDQLNFDTGAVGGAFAELKGKRLIVSLDKTLYKKDKNDPNEEEKDNQQWKGYRPLSRA
jgi:hypothetical protein